MTDIEKVLQALKLANELIKEQESALSYYKSIIDQYEVKIQELIEINAHLCHVIDLHNNVEMTKH